MPVGRGVSIPLGVRVDQTLSDRRYRDGRPTPSKYLAA